MLDVFIMRPYLFISLSYLILYILSFHASAATYGPILAQLKPATITIIGETHKRTESIQVFQGLMTDYLRQKKCLTVGLEINSEEQLVIDRVMQGRAVAAEIKISTIIDHPPMRKMIDDFAALKKEGACLEVIAIDTGIETKHNRDVWMAKQLPGS